MVRDLLTNIVVKAVKSFPRQGLWTVLAVVKSSSADRASKGMRCLRRIEVSFYPQMDYSITTQAEA